MDPELDPESVPELGTSSIVEDNAPFPEELAGSPSTEEILPAVLSGEFGLLDVADLLLLSFVLLLSADLNPTRAAA